MPLMPKSYSSELVNLIKAMLNQNPDKRPSVNRILRDPYIKRNIAVFIEGTKKRFAFSKYMYLIVCNVSWCHIIEHIY